MRIVFEPLCKKLQYLEGGKKDLILQLAKQKGSNSYMKLNYNICTLGCQWNPFQLHGAEIKECLWALLSCMYLQCYTVL
jgi:hypothetical protein